MAYSTPCKEPSEDIKRSCILDDILRIGEESSEGVLKDGKRTCSEESLRRVEGVLEGRWKEC
jgi:hypothetical protein